MREKWINATGTKLIVLLSVCLLLLPVRAEAAEKKSNTYIMGRLAKEVTYTGQPIDWTEYNSTIRAYNTDRMEYRDLDVSKMTFTYYTYEQGEEFDSAKTIENPITPGMYWVVAYYPGDAVCDPCYSDAWDFHIAPERYGRVEISVEQNPETRVGDEIQVRAELKTRVADTLPVKGYIEFTASGADSESGEKVSYASEDFEPRRAELNERTATARFTLKADQITSIRADFTPTADTAEEYIVKATYGTYTQLIQCKKKTQESLSAKALKLAYGKSASPLEVSGGSGAGDLHYQSSNKKIAAVDELGNVTPKGVGKAAITVTKAGDLEYYAAQTTAAVTVTKGENTSAPKKPVLKSATKNTIEMKTVKGQEYSIDNGKTWKSGGTFRNLQSGHKYTVLTRLKATELYKAGTRTAFLAVTTEAEKAALNNNAGTGGTTAPATGSTSGGSGTETRNRLTTTSSVTPASSSSASGTGTSGTRTVRTISNSGTTTLRDNRNASSGDPGYAQAAPAQTGDASAAEVYLAICFAAAGAALMLCRRMRRTYGQE